MAILVMKDLQKLKVDFDGRTYMYKLDKQV